MFQGKSGKLNNRQKLESLLRDCACVYSVVDNERHLNSDCIDTLNNTEMMSQKKILVAIYQNI